MSDDLILGVLIGLVAGVILTLIIEWWHDRHMEMWVKSFDQDEDEEEAEDSDPPAKAIDPDDPPRWVVFNPKSSDAIRRCICHNFVIETGQPIMWWPVPDGLPGQVDLFCEEGIGVRAPVPE